MKSPKHVFVAGALLLVSSCAPKVNQNCPDFFRGAVKWAPANEHDALMKADDCLRERTTQLSAGPSSDHDVAQAAISYCGSYDWPTNLGPDTESAKRESRDALGWVVAERAFKCPQPRHRQPDGSLS